MNNITSWQGHSGVLLDEKNNFKIIDCDTCGFAHIVPIPTEEELDQVYKEQYYSIEKPLYIERMKEDSEWWDITYTDRYDTFEEQLGRKGRILDVGSGTGYFLKYGVNRGWDTIGIEPSRQAAEHSKSELKLTIVEEFLGENNYKKLGLFDVIHLSQVLEHIPDPKKLLELIFKMLKPGSIVCVTVPNDFNPFQKTLTSLDNYPSWWIAPPHHVNYFNFKSLNGLLSKIGFSVFLQETTFPIDLFLLMGDNYINNDELGRACHKKRIRFETLITKAGYKTLKRKLYQEFSKLDIGREVVLFAKK
jgi:SAM-dependent methyltransferase